MSSTYLHGEDSGVAKHIAPALKEFGQGGLTVKWKNVGSAKPSSGVELDNSALAAALQIETDFPMAEMIKFKVPTLSYECFIKSGHDYFKPASLPPISERRKLLAHVFNRAREYEEARNPDAHPVFGPGSVIKSADEFIDKPANSECILLSATLQKRIVTKVL